MHPLLSRLDPILLYVVVEGSLTLPGEQCGHNSTEAAAAAATLGVMIFLIVGGTGGAACAGGG